MPANIDHKCFIQPKDSKIKLWRYMDFTKFVSLISKEELFFCRADLFKDPFEGSYSKANSILSPLVYAKSSIDSGIPIERLIQSQEIGNNVLAKFRRQWYYISCWHKNEFESAAMWDLYSNGEGSIAIETNYELLQNNLPDNSYMGLVKYIDYQTEWLPEGNTFFPFMHKRKSFEHESEVRIVISDEESIPRDKKGYDLNSTNPRSGVFVPIKLGDVINTIHISPLTPSWMVDAIRDVSNKYGITSTIKQSNLYNDPFTK
tara:strand:- start:1574 stop:2353 length:780 start_codon:yes stop_codon:yes gene_type:complete